jgi:hypothetical protein
MVSADRFLWSRLVVDDSWSGVRIFNILVGCLNDYSANGSGIGWIGCGC